MTTSTSTLESQYMKEYWDEKAWDKWWESRGKWSSPLTLSAAPLMANDPGQWKFVQYPDEYEKALKLNQAIQAMDNDVINHPKHYIEGRKYEPIAVIEDWNLSYHLGNVLKYISRAGRKGESNTKQDLEKARWYLQRAIDQIG